MKISQAGSVISDDGRGPAELVRRVLARFPDLNEPAGRRRAGHRGPAAASLTYEVTLGTDGRLLIRSSTQLSASRGSRWAAVPDASRSLPGRGRRTGARSGWPRPASAAASSRSRCRVRDAAADLRRASPRWTASTAVNVTATFVAAAPGDRRRAGPPRWETVLAADSAGRLPGRAQRLRALARPRPGNVWRRTSARPGPASIVAAARRDPAGPLHRRPRPAREARRGGAGRRGVPARPVAAVPDGGPARPRRSSTGTTVSVIPGDAEQLYVPAGFGSGDSGGGKG